MEVHIINRDADATLATEQTAVQTRGEEVVAAKSPAAFALAALQAIPAFEPVSSVDYQSSGRLLVLADSQSYAALQQSLVALSPLSIAVLWDGKRMQSGAAPTFVDVEVLSAKLLSLEGYLGAFALTFDRGDGQSQQTTFDLVLDLHEAPAFTMHSPPQGYFHAANAD